jgi:hypothetical protein
MTDQQLIETLLYRGEGEALDFKLEQYKLEKASDDEKSELLKDILAFANSWREVPAYIVIGVRESSREAEGLDKDIDDAKLQQFINEKTNKPIHFSYHSLDFDGKKVGLYTIPVQERPFYLKKPFGRLKSDVVYVRRGSSTAEAKPDEIAKMGAHQSVATTKPNLKVSLISLDEHAARYDSLAIDYTDYLTDESNPLPDYGVDHGVGLPFLVADHFANKDYYRQMAVYAREQSGRFGFRIEIENSGSAFADDIRVYLSAPSSPGFKLMESIDFRNRPKTRRFEIDVTAYRVNSPFARSYLTLSSVRGYEVAEILMGKIQAGETKYSPAIYLMCPPETLEQLSIKVLSDHLGSPIDISVPVIVTRRELLLTANHIDELEPEGDDEDEE